MLTLIVLLISIVLFVACQMAFVILDGFVEKPWRALGVLAMISVLARFIGLIAGCWVGMRWIATYGPKDSVLFATAVFLVLVWMATKK